MPNLKLYLCIRAFRTIHLPVPKTLRFALPDSVTTNKRSLSPSMERERIEEMISLARRVRDIFRLPSQGINSLSQELRPLQIQQWRGIRVQVYNGNLERALTLLQRKMQSSGIERMIKREQTHHIKNSEKRVLARKRLQQKIQSQELARKLKAILIKKVRGL